MSLEVRGSALLTLVCHRCKPSTFQVGVLSDTPEDCVEWWAVPDAGTFTQVLDMRDAFAPAADIVASIREAWATYDASKGRDALRRAA